MPLPSVGTLPSSGNLDLVTIGEYFLDTAPFELDDFYRGGAFVPDVPANAGIPTSGPLGIRDFLGATRATVQLSSQSLVALAMSPTDAWVTYEVNIDGEVKKIASSGTTVLETWLLDGSVAEYEVMFTSDSGEIPSGSVMNTWLALSSSRAITVTRTDDTAGSDVGTVTVEIRKAGESVQMALASVSLTATVLDPA